MSRGKSGDGGFVYFMRRVDGVGPVKIGCSKVPLARLEIHQQWSPEPLEIVTSAPGTFRDEQRLHRQFDGCRLHAEWFEAIPALLSMVARVKMTGALPPALLSDRSIRMAEMYQAGGTLQKIGDEFGVSRERVRQILRSESVPSLGSRPENAPRSIAGLNADKVVRLCREGRNVIEIAEAIGDAATNVRCVLNRHGLKAVRKCKDRDPKTVEMAFAVAAEYRRGDKCRVIAERHGILTRHVFRLLSIAGVKAARNRKRAA